MWLTVQKLSIALNSKTASFTTWACTCASRIFFLIFKYGPMLQQSVSVTLLLVAFAFGRPSCSNLGGQSFRRFFRKTKLIKFLGLGLVPSRERLELDQIVGVRTGLPEDQLDQIFGSGPVFQTQTVRERRNFGEGISSRSVHGSSRHADLRHREVWLTVQKLSIALNSKTASFTTWACTCASRIFF